jgi:hypothetical protein
LKLSVGGDGQESWGLASWLSLSPRIRKHAWRTWFENISPNELQYLAILVKSSAARPYYTPDDLAKDATTNHNTHSLEPQVRLYHSDLSLPVC